MPDAPPAADGSGPAARFSIVGPRTIVFVLTLLAVEFVLKYGLGYGWWTVNERSERYGWQMLPDQDARSRDLTVEEHINHGGFRDRDWPPPVRAADGGWVKDDSLLRVAVVGNSMTYGTSVPVDEVYPRVLERLLAAELGERGSSREAYVMNFAVQGYCLEQMARVYEDFIRPYRPDVLVVPMHFMDVMPMKPSADDADYDMRQLVMRTATYDMLVRHVIDRWIPPLPRSDEARKEARRFALIETALKEQPFSAENRKYFDAAGELLETMRLACEADGGRLCVVPLPRWRKHFDPKLLNTDSFLSKWAYDRKPAVFYANPWPEFARLQKPVIDDILAHGLPGGEAFDLSIYTWTDAQGVEHRGDEIPTADQSLHLLDDMGHYTARGHAVVAQSIVDALVSGGALD